MQNATTAARALGREIEVFKAGTRDDIEVAFATLGGHRFDAVFVAPDPMFASQSARIAALAALHALPASYFSVQPWPYLTRLSKP
ncbi:MAG: hypothetical protein WCE24_18690 [Pseudolabrys sp.]